MYMKVLSTSFNNQRVTFDRDAKNTTFYRIEDVGFRSRVPRKEHLREALLFCFHLKKSAAESHRLLVKAYGEACSIWNNFESRDWFRWFKDNDLNVNDKERSDQPKKFEDGELETLLQENSCQMLKETLSETLNVER